MTAMTMIRQMSAIHQGSIARLGPSLMASFSPGPAWLHKSPMYPGAQAHENPSTRSTQVDVSEGHGVEAQSSIFVSQRSPVKPDTQTQTLERQRAPFSQGSGPPQPPGPGASVTGLIVLPIGASDGMVSSQVLPWNPVPAQSHSKPESSPLLSQEAPLAQGSGSQ